MLTNRVPFLGRTVLRVKDGICKVKRNLNLHEYQSKNLMNNYGINIQPFFITAKLKEDLTLKLKNLNCNEYVIKAQVLAGGRKKGHFKDGFQGGVHLTKNKNSVNAIVQKMLGNTLITKQTGSKGLNVDNVMVAKALDLEKEAYLAILLDRESCAPVIIASKHGGVNIESLPENEIFKFYIHNVEDTLKNSIAWDMAIEIAKKLDFRCNDMVLNATAQQIQNLYSMFISVDATLLEVNPLGQTPDGEVVSFDAKINFDDNALYRQKDIFNMENTMDSQTDEYESIAKEIGINYIGMDGNIGCIINGAGLAMATMDEIQLAGGKPANFLDVGGKVTEEQMNEAFKLLINHKSVKTIFINIFGGIVDCSLIAKSLSNSIDTLNVEIPFIVRFVGSNSKKAKEILINSKSNIYLNDDFRKAALLSVSKSSG
ncbi:hypothetical protein A3Q56_03690 [Intoshia linei]|uniref:Succinyl-CoA synthetase beta chain n=1 Tax=Intoshia linei TaxID=1819745 RepID=A0A177B4N9_9BILA|nr:hypothetical protein A3Q56_03690 [Intoshia linei]